MEEEVIHEKENERFVLYSEGNEVYLEYSMIGNDLNLYHTYTHPALRGKGWDEVETFIKSFEYHCYSKDIF